MRGWTTQGKKMTRGDVMGAGMRLVQSRKPQWIHALISRDSRFEDHENHG
jgi:hypothetical protein